MHSFSRVCSIPCVDKMKIVAGGGCFPESAFSHELARAQGFVMETCKLKTMT